MFQTSQNVKILSKDGHYWHRLSAILKYKSNPEYLYFLHNFINQIFQCFFKLIMQNPHFWERKVVKSILKYSDNSQESIVLLVCQRHLWRNCSVSYNAQVQSALTKRCFGVDFHSWNESTSLLTQHCGLMYFEALTPLLDWNLSRWVLSITEHSDITLKFKLQRVDVICHCNSAEGWPTKLWTDLCFYIVAADIYSYQWRI